MRLGGTGWVEIPTDNARNAPTLWSLRTLGPTSRDARLPTPTPQLVPSPCPNAAQPCLGPEPKPANYSQA